MTSRICDLPRTGKKPGGLCRRASGSGSERDVIVVDELTVVALGLLGPAEEIHRLGYDLAAVAVVALLVGPFGVVDAAADQNLIPFSQYCWIVLPRPLKEVMRCHSVS